MSRINIGKSDQYVEKAKSTDWNIELGTYDLSKATQSLEFEDAISQPGNFTLDLVIDPGEINGGDRLHLDKEGVGAFNGVVTQPERSSQRDDTIKGGGAAKLLSDIPINGEFLGTTTQDVVTNVFSQLSTTAIKVGVNEELSDGTGVVDVRAEDEGALKLLNRVVLSHGGEWYVSYDSVNDVFEFNVVNELRSGTVQGTFTEDGIKEVRDTQVVDEEYDAVVVKGYGDGDDQIIGEYPARTNWPNDPEILRYTDKTILSQQEADSTAESVYNDHTEWRNIYLYPANENELFGLGDEVEINDANTGINSTFRVVHRKFSIDYGQGNGIEYVLSDRPIGMLDEGEDIREQTDSQTDYMQGSRNVWGEKETSNASNSDPLELDFYVPSDVRDATGKNTTNKIVLNYQTEKFRNSAGATKVDTQESPQSSNYNTDVNDPGAITMKTTQIQQDTSSTSTDAASSSGATIGGTLVTSQAGYKTLGSATLPDPIEPTAAVGHHVQWRNGSVTSDDNLQLALRIRGDSTGDGTVDRTVWEERRYIPNVVGVGNGWQMNFSIDVLDDFVGNKVALEAAIDDGSTSAEATFEGALSFIVLAEHDHTVAPAHKDTDGNDYTEDTVWQSSDSLNDGSNTKNEGVDGGLNDSVSVGNKANEVSIKVDGTDKTSDIYGTSTSGTDQDSAIDITSYLTTDSDGKPDTGWHKVKIVPEPAGTVSFVKSRVFLDHKKDA